MTRKEFIEKAKVLCEKLLASKDIDYVLEVLPITKSLTLQIILERDDIDKDNFGEPLHFEFYVDKHGTTVDGITVETTRMEDCEKDLDYLLKCVTKWD